MYVYESGSLRVCLGQLISTITMCWRTQLASSSSRNKVSQCSALQEEAEDWSAAAALLLDGCNLLARQEMSKVPNCPSSILPC